MPRAPGAQPVVGGRMDPGTLRSLEQERMFRKQKEIAAMQERGAMARAQMGAVATMGAAKMRETGAGERAKTAEAGAEKRLAITEAGAKERTAMQIEADDRREAERVQGKEDDRLFLLELEEHRQQLRNKQWQIEQDWHKAEKLDDQEWKREIEDERMETELAFAAQGRDESIAFKAAMLGVLKKTMATNTQRQKAEIKFRNKKKERRDYVVNLDIIEENIDRTMESNKEFGADSFPIPRRYEAQKNPTLINEYIDETMNREFKNIGLQNVTMEMFTQEGYPKLEKLVEQGVEGGGIGVGELETLKMALDKGMAMFKTREGETKGKLSWNKKFYDTAYRRLVGADIKFDALNRSENEKVRSAYKAAVLSVKRVTGDDALNEVFDVLGVDGFDAALEILLKMWQGRAEMKYEIRKPFGGFLRETAEMNVEMLESLLGGK